ncbi:MAG TPA: tetratricopeptide repeat protein, partial [Bacteroidia bacterium]|nr:tetratricopeptide repeat protein [Bacteroidia bacterium]
MTKNVSFRVLVTFLLALIVSVPAFSQQYTAAETKLVEKAKAYYEKSKYDKAIETLKKVQPAHFYDNDLWELRCSYERDRYNVQLITDYITILKKMGKGTTNFDFSKFKSTQYRQEMINSCSTATLVCGKQEVASKVLHEQFIEPSGVDSAVGDEAKDEYNKGGDDYTNQNYTSAIRSFEKALKIDSSYYYANFKIGMCYYNDEKYEKAVPYFRKAISLEPDMLDPRVNLVDCFMKTKSWQDAYNACIDGIIAYPDTRLFNDLDEIADKLGKTFNRHWMSRDYLPGMITATNQEAVTAEPWSYYREAKDKIGDYCNDKGIVKKKLDFTEQKYLETYAW